MTRGCLMLVIRDQFLSMPENEALTMAYQAIQSGARGVDMGRNIFQSEHPVAMCQAVAKVVHERFTDKEAYEFYLNEINK